MRPSILVLAPLLTGLVVLPAEGQVAARLHVDIPIGRPGVAVYGAPRREIVVRDYDPNLFGGWDSYYDQWVPQTVYLYDGNYYDYPIVEYAQPILAYQFRGQFFFAPRVPEFVTWQQRYHYRDYVRFGSIGHGFGGGYVGRSRPITAPHDVRGYAAPRQVAPQRDQRQFEAPRGRQPQPAPQQGGRGPVGGRDGGRGRPHGGH